MPLAHHLDRFLEWLKWPAALLALLLLLPSLVTTLELLRGILGAPAPLLPFAGGFLAYLLLWWLWLRRPIFGSFFSTMEHELTHALFAWLTFHRVTGLRASWRRGGQMTFVGRGNWLIIIAPYFFPTLCLLVLLLSLLLPGALRGVSDILMGGALAYHVTSTMRETHPGQTDLARVGWLFSAMFLPAANVISFGAIVSYAHTGPRGLLEFLLSVPQPLLRWSGLS